MFVHYAGMAGAILRPILGPVIVSVAAVIAIVAIAVRHLTVVSSWAYALLSAVLITTGRVEQTG
jgi:hypothetical protein